MQRFFIFGGLVAGLLVQSAVVGAADDAQKRKERPDAKARETQNLEKYDTNGNGKIDPEERQAAGGKAQSANDEDRNKRLLERYDANGNGKLDPEEQEKVKADRPEKEASGRESLLKDYDANGNGKLDPEELEKAKADRPEKSSSRDDLLKKYDANGDGQLDAEERSKAREERGKTEGDRPQKTRSREKDEPKKE